MAKSGAGTRARLAGEALVLAGLARQHRQETAPACRRVDAVWIEEREGRIADPTIRKRAEDQAAAERRALEHVQHAERLGMAARGGKRRQGFFPCELREERRAAAGAKLEVRNIGEVGAERGV